MPLFVGLPIEAERCFRLDLLGTTALVPRPFSHCRNSALSISLVAEKLPGCFGTADQALGRRTIVRLAAAQQDGKKTALSICDCVDFRIAPAT